MKRKFPYKGLSTPEVLDGAKNYNRWIAESLALHAKEPMIEIGAGIGNITEYFLEKGELVVTDIDLVLLKKTKQKFKLRRRIQFGIYNVINYPKRAWREAFRGCVAVNVLEHILDDKKALLNLNALLEKNGVLLLLVPAKRFAYTKLDENLGHFRRYEKNELYKKVTDAGFSVEKLYYFNIVGLLSWMVRTRIEKNHLSLSKKQIAIFDKVVPLLRLIESVIPVPVGISLICVAIKTGK